MYIYLQILSKDCNGGGGGDFTVVTAEQHRQSYI